MSTQVIDFAEFARKGLPAQQERAEVRRKLHTGEASLSDVLRDPPESIKRLNLYEVVTMARGMGRRRMEDLGRLALADSVNLMIRVDRVSERSITWLEFRMRPAVGQHGGCATIR